MADFPIVMTTQGPVPLSPQFLRDTLTAAVAAINPGYTNNLPGDLIEDIASTDVGALIAMDQALVDLINSVTPFGANEFILNQLGQIYGVTPNLPSLTSVNLVFNGPAGLVLPVGFTVSDGTHQYFLQDGGVIPLDGITLPLFAVATVSGSWVVPANTVNKLVTPAPPLVSLTVNNPLAGIAGQGVESVESYRARVLQAGRASATGMASFVKTLLSKVPGVVPRLVSVIQSPAGGVGWEIIVGGGDPVAVAYAIYQADFWIPGLVPSVIQIAFITATNPAQVTTTLNHGKSTGDTVFLSGITAAGGFTALNGTSQVVTVIDEKHFTIAFNASGFTPAFTGSGEVDPNPRNQTVAILDYPDTYEIPYVIPPQQSLAITMLWNTDSPNFVSGPAVNALAVPALVDYVNGIFVGAPFNIFDAEFVFQQAIAAVLPTEFVSRMVWTITINGIATPPNTGTGLVFGDPESYFLTDSTQINVSQG
jgi:hypothetical protein